MRKCSDRLDSDFVAEKIYIDQTKQTVALIKRYGIEVFFKRIKILCRYSGICRGIKTCFRKSRET